MAEKQVVSKPVVPTESKPQAREIEIVFSSEKVTYKALVKFSSFEEILKHAGESVGRVIQARIRDKKKSYTFPTGRTVEVDHGGNFVKSDEDILKEVEAMSPEEVAAQKAHFEKMVRIFNFKSTN